MGLLDHLWDDVVAGPQPARGLGKLRKTTSVIQSRSPPGGDDEEVQVTKSITMAKSYNRSLSIDAISAPSSPTSSSPRTPCSPSTPRGKDNVWSSVFNPEINKATGLIGSEKLEKAEPNSKTVLYTEEMSPNGVEAEEQKAYCPP